MTELNRMSWWERETDSRIVLTKIKNHTRTVARQIGVALDMAQAPLGSDQETFPTLEPEEAEKLMKQKSK